MKNLLLIFFCILLTACANDSDFSTTANIYSHLDATSKVNSLSALEGVVAL